MGTSPTPATPAPEGPRIGAVGRMIGAMFNPKETFADIARSPSWLAPMALFIALGLPFAWMMNQRVDWGNYIRQQAEKSPRFADLPEDQKQRALAPQVRFAPMFTYAIGLLGSPIFILVMTLVFLPSMNLMGGAGAKFKQAFGITTHAMMPTSIFSVLGFTTMGLRRFGDVDPEHLLASNPGAFLGADAPRWLFVMLSSFEVFWLWALVLLAFGYSAINPKKVSVGKAAGIIFGVWIFWVLIKTGASAAFS